jgi:hypothetical protein
LAKIVAAKSTIKIKTEKGEIVANPKVVSAAVVETTLSPQPIEESAETTELQSSEVSAEIKDDHNDAVETNNTKPFGDFLEEPFEQPHEVTEVWEVLVASEQMETDLVAQIQHAEQGAEGVSEVSQQHQEGVESPSGIDFMEKDPRRSCLKKCHMIQSKMSKLKSKKRKTLSSKRSRRIFNKKK